MSFTGTFLPLMFGAKRYGMDSLPGGEV